MSHLAFGVNNQVSLPDHASVASGNASSKPLEDVTSEVAAALQNPIEFPPLCDIIVPDDRVAIVLEDGISCVDEVVAGIVGELFRAGVEPHNICVLRSTIATRYSQSSPTNAVDSTSRELIDVVDHDSEDRESLSYLGVGTDDVPIYLNRRIVDADLVIPVGTLKPRDTLAYLGVHGAIMRYSDDETIKRFSVPKSSLSSEERELRRNEAGEVAWMLGVRMTVQIVPGPCESVLRVLAGDAEHVERTGGEISEQIWNVKVPARASLVVAGIGGGKQQQTWENFARALDAALKVVENEGSIAICSDLNARPGPAIRKLLGAADLDRVRSSVDQEDSFDALPARQLINALQHARVYLLSGLDEELVEDLGVAYVSEVEDISRLAGRHGSCIALENAQYVKPVIEEQ